jgi:endoglucanase
MYRNDGVDIDLDQKSKNYYVNHIETTEWLQYTVAAEARGRYTLKVVVAAGTDTGKLAVTVNNGETRVIAVPNTGGELQWTAITLRDVELFEGNNTFVLRAEKGGYNLSALQLVPAGR